VVSHDGIIKPYPENPKSCLDCIVTAWDRVSNLPSYLVEGYIVDAKSPHKVSDIADVLLVGLRGKNGFK
jgi:hypothetical protein